MVATKEELRDAFYAGMRYNHTWEHYSESDFPVEFEAWYAREVLPTNRDLVRAEIFKRGQEAAQEVMRDFIGESDRPAPDPAGYEHVDSFTGDSYVWHIFVNKR